MPMLKRGLAFFGKEALRTGAKIANDVADGRPVREAAKRRIGERINDYVPGLIPQSGSGKRRRNIKPKRRLTYKRRKAVTKKDIFD
jgi:hypothetical protein